MDSSSGSFEGPVVVGLDGSRPSLVALRAAADEAKCRSAPLHVLRAWTLRSASRPPGLPPATVPSLDEYAGWMREHTVRVVADCLGEAEEVTVGAPRGRAVTVLLAASATAGLLVLGHRGRGGRLMLGSVAAQCVRAAECPVLVVR
ncbi:universal stress protein [Actinoalloteichus caeruleus]|uniref:universal stress protein n=1 Tax=Actinoalloteichus cyanogriseus TaxID=2893586 RepID=UPI0004AB920D|nr:universal stress protein [Actinoalloteichus caeruleus]